jgi:hypothetical protein
MRGGIRLALILWRLALLAQRLLGYQWIAKIWGITLTLFVFALPNIHKSLIY